MFSIQTSKATKLVKKKVLKNPLRKNQSSQRGSWRIADNLFTSFLYATQGLKYAFSSQRNFRIHVIIGVIAFGLGVWLDLKFNLLAILVLTITSVLILELINTSIEAVVDLAIGKNFHPLARIARDCSAAAVLLASISSLIIAILLLLPPLISQLNS